MSTILEKIATLVQAGYATQQTSMSVAEAICAELIIDGKLQHLDLSIADVEMLLRTFGWEREESLRAFLTRLEGRPAGVSPSGLLRFTQSKIGLVVSAAEHEHVVAKLQKDKERLDWLQSDKGFIVIANHTGDKGLPFGLRKATGGENNLREHIDAAMQLSEANPPR